MGNVIRIQKKQSGGGVSPSGIAYNRPQLTGQSISYRVGDDGWHYQNGTYDYTPPVYPVNYAKLDTFVLLVDNNDFGNKNRFTDIDGLQVYGDNYVIDHYTGLGWYNVVFGASQDWNTNIDQIHSATILGYSDWRMHNINEISRLINIGASLSAPLDYPPFNQTGTPWQVSQTSSTHPVNTTDYIRYVINSNFSIGRDDKSLSISSRGYLPIRNHYN